MKKRALSLFLSVLMLLSSLSILAGCKDENVDYSGEKANMVVELDKVEFEVNTINKPVTNQEVAVFTRGYSVDGSTTAYIGGDHTDRVVVTVRYTASHNEYSIIAVDESEGDKAQTLIPVNGIVISVLSSLVTDLRIREGQVIDVFGFDVSNYEYLDLASFIPTKSNLARRIYYVNPAETIVEELIYLVNEEYEKDITLGANELAVVLKFKSGSNYGVESILESGTVTAGTTAIIFKGKYNCEYALAVIEEGNNIMLSKLEEANSVSHESAVVINDVVYKIGSVNTNVTTLDDGIYLFDSAHVSGTTPSSDKGFVAIAVDNGSVMYKGEENERLVIPTNSGYVLVFSGELKSLAANYTLGGKVNELLIFPENTPEQFVKINGYCYSFNNIDIFVENEAVLYTYGFGETTGTRGAVAEIAIKDGKVVSVTTSGGNTAIPENGFVLSFPAKGDNLVNCKNVKSGDSVRLALSACDYSLDSLDITAFNDVRYTDYLVIYDKGNTRTGTNQYGYEIGVDKNGVMVSASNAGNMLVPDGGFVISGHGVMAEAISDLYIYGGTVKCLKDEKQLVFFSTPVSAKTDVSATLESVKQSFALAESALYDIDYEYISSKLDACKTLIDSADSSISDGDPIDAINNLYLIQLMLGDLEGAMITDKAVEERSVWYRSNVKSDEDVLAVIQKCVEYNINAIYLETWYNGKTVGMTENPLIQHYTAQHGDYDALEGFIRIGHEHGIQIHAWVENFFIGTTSQQESDPEHISNHNDSWILLDKDGKGYYVSPEYGNFIFLNPQNRECRDFVLSVYRELLENYDIDGIHLDYIRYPEHNGKADFGYNADTIKAFQDEYGHKGNPKTYVSGTQQYRDWIQFRRDVITSFVKEVNDLVKEIRPEVWITAACYPSLSDSPNNIYQHAAEWVKLGYIDQVFSMTYSNGTEYVSSNAQSFINACKDKALYSTGLTLFSGNSGEELLSQINATREVGATGQALFSLSSLLGFEEYENIIINHAYRTKAVSLFDVDAAIAAYAEDIITKCDGVYSEHTTGQDASISAVKKLLEEVKAEAGKKEYVTVEEQNALLEYALERTESILAEAAKADGALKTALEREVGEMDYNLSILYSRMQARLAQ